ncbi:hypothetical protein [Clostridium sp. ZBS12]|uniref:hypothetical protein n=1 Tax=Clostridium sp. ZBS12 TaxID=2949972 RepID=UPI002079602C|nr:hypothetical protein [Clostridium sp. ZBS12]
MVYYYLEINDEKCIKYKYYPEDNKKFKSGTIIFDKILKTIEIESAEKDFERYAEELNERWYWYADHAVRSIINDYYKGIVREVGMVAWY